MTTLRTARDASWARQRWPRQWAPLVAAGAAGAAGLMTGTGVAPLGWWLAPPLGVMVLTVAVHRSTSLRAAAAVGLAYGLGLSGPTLGWMAAIHPAALVGLLLLSSSWSAVTAVLVRAAGRSRGWPVLAALAWLGVEFLAARVPFGGFGWLRLGYTQIDSPLAGLYPFIGVAGVSFSVVLTGQLGAWILLGPSRRRLAWSAAWLVVVTGAATAGTVTPTPPPDGVVTAGWVQGGAPGGGVYGLGPPRTITTNQARATRELAEKIDAGRLPAPDFVVWPENATDLDPDTDQRTGQLVEQSVAAVGRPVLVGAILDGPGPGQRRTAAQWREPDGRIGPTYQKRSIVPFGEWIPFRDVLLPLIPALRYVGAQSVAGTDPGLLDVQLPDGRSITLGVLACFDVAFDPVVHDLATAQAVIVQSNNAMYQGTAQIEQQFAITRARAAELRRDTLVVTTSGITGLIDPTGRVTMKVTEPGPAVGVVQLGLRTGTTTASWLATPLEVTATVAAALWITALTLTPSPRRRFHPLVGS